MLDVVDLTPPMVLPAVAALLLPEEPRLEAEALLPL